MLGVEERKMKEKKIEKIVRELLETLEIPYPEETPRAVAKMYLDLLRGYGRMDIKRTFPICFPAPARKQIIRIENIRFYTFCAHHMLPFLGFVHVAYVPDKKVIGLSKPARVVDHFSKRLQMQETLTQQVLDTLFEIIEPVAIVVETEAVHLCSVMRGIRTPDEVVRVRAEKVDEEKYYEADDHTRNLVKDLLKLAFKDKPTMPFLRR